MRKHLPEYSLLASGLPVLVCALFMTAPSFAEPPVGGCPAGTPRIFVDKDANIDLNGKRVTPQELEEALLALDPKPTRACYAHGLLKGNPIPGSLSAMRILVGLELEVVLYTDETFTTLDPAN